MGIIRVIVVCAVVASHSIDLAICLKPRVTRIEPSGGGKGTRLYIYGEGKLKHATSLAKFVPKVDCRVSQAFPRIAVTLEQKV